MFALIITTVTLIALLVSFYTDMTTREVPDWVSYGLIFSALGIRLIFSVDFGWKIFVSGLIGFVVMLGLAYFFYYTHQWGGGDSKLLMGMGAVIGIQYPFSAESFTLLWFFLLLLFVGAFWGLLAMGYLAIKNRNKFYPVFVKTVKKFRVTHITLGFVMISLGILVYFIHVAWPLLFFPLGLFYLFAFVSSVEQSCFIKQINPNKLTEGDWLAEDVIVGRKKIIGACTLGKLEMENLQRLHKEGKLKKVTVKEGIPFVPSFFFSYIILLFGGNWVVRVVSMLW